MARYIDFTSGEEREAIKRKSPLGMPDNPTQRGWKPDAIRKQFTQFVITDTVPPDEGEDGSVVIHEKHSFMAELDRVVAAINAVFADKDDELQAFMERAVTIQSLYEAIHPGEDGTEASITDAVDGLVTEQELNEALATLVEDVIGSLDVRSAIKLAIKYLMGTALFETQAQAATYNALYTTALAYLDGNWLTGEGGYVPPSPGGWSIDASGDWIIINAAPVMVGTDYIIFGGTPL